MKLIKVKCSDTVTHFAIVKNGKIMTYGSDPNFDKKYYEKLAKGYSGVLEISNKPFLTKASSNEPLFFGITWEELNNKQHRR